MQPFLLRQNYHSNSMFSFTSIHQQIESEIKSLHFNYPPKSLYDPIEYILSLGGKRLRPSLTLMACNLYTDNLNNAICPALGWEVFHNFTLLHDDLMDKADRRRNKPTVHKVWNENTAILSGDAMLITAYQLIGQTEFKYLKEILDLFTGTALEICGGQQFDMEFENRKEVTEEEYLEMIRLKTAVLIGACLKTGAILANAPAKDALNLYLFGVHIGLAFQLQDDLLDVYGNPATFGKNIGGDILCNKKTFLLINALKKANPQQKEILEEWMEKTAFDPNQKIAVFTEIYNNLKIKELTKKKIESYYDKAIFYLNSVSVDKKKLEVLTDMANQLMGRQY